MNCARLFLQKSPQLRQKSKHAAIIYHKLIKFTLWTSPHFENSILTMEMTSYLQNVFFELVRLDCRLFKQHTLLLHKRTKRNLNLWSPGDWCLNSGGPYLGDLLTAPTGICASWRTGWMVTNAPYCVFFAMMLAKKYTAEKKWWDQRSCLSH